MKKRKHARQPSERQRLERMLGRKFLAGEIPVVPPGQLPRCPVPATHVKDFDQTCRDYEDGKISYEDVLARVGETLKSLRKPDEPPKEESPSG